MYERKSPRPYTDMHPNPARYTFKSKGQMLALGRAIATLIFDARLQRRGGMSLRFPPDTPQNPNANLTGTQKNLMG